MLGGMLLIHLPRFSLETVTIGEYCLIAPAAHSCSRGYLCAQCDHESVGKPTLGSIVDNNRGPDCYEKGFGGHHKTEPVSQLARHQLKTILF